MTRELLPSAGGVDPAIAAALLLKHGGDNPYVQDAVGYLERASTGDEKTYASYEQSIEWILGEHAIASGNEELATQVYEAASLEQRILLLAEAETTTERGVSSQMVADWRLDVESREAREQLQRDRLAQAAQTLVSLERGLAEYQDAKRGKRALLSDIVDDRGTLLSILGRHGFDIPPERERFYRTRMNVAFARAGLFTEMVIETDGWGLSSEDNSRIHALLGSALVGQLTSGRENEIMGTGLRAGVRRKRDGLRSKISARIDRFLDPYDYDRQRRSEQRPVDSTRALLNAEKITRMQTAAREINAAARSERGLGSIALSEEVTVVGRDIFVEAMPRTMAEIDVAVFGAQAVRMHLANGDVTEATRAYTNMRTNGHADLRSHLRAALMLSRRPDDARATKEGHAVTGDFLLTDVGEFAVDLAAVLGADEVHGDVLETLGSELDETFQTFVSETYRQGDAASLVRAYGMLLRLAHEKDPSYTHGHYLIERINKGWSALEENISMLHELQSVRQDMESLGYGMIRVLRPAGYLGYAFVPNFPDMQWDRPIPTRGWWEENRSQATIKPGERALYRETVARLNQLVGEERYGIQSQYAIAYGGGESVGLWSTRNRYTVSIHELTHTIEAVMVRGRALHPRPEYTAMVEAAVNARPALPGSAEA